MRYRVLGPLEVQDGPRMVPLRQGRQRLLLAVLLLRANETVSSDRLIDALWGEEPPATAGSSLHNLVSGLRRDLGDGRLVTRDGGYALQVADGELDAERFDLLARNGRAALAAGDPERAASVLREALELWRGPPLGELAYHQALAGEAERLEEARLAALEERIEADLARGRHADVVAELEGLVARHPLRERLRGQQMVALYRSGRQADALAAYRDARERLVDELGVEPGPALRRIEQAVLEQDPALGAPDALPHAPPAVAWARRHAGALLAAGILLFGAVAVVLLARDGDDVPSRAATAPARDFLATIDPQTDRIAQRLPVGETPTAVAVGAGAAWTINADAQSISRVDLRTRAVRTFATGAVPLDIAAGEDAAWLVSSELDPRAGREAVPPPETLSQLDPASGTPVANVTLPPASGPTFRGPPQIAAVGGGAVWAIGRSGWLLRVDQRTGRSASLREQAALSVASGDGEVWVLAEQLPDEPDVRLLRLDPRSGRVLERVVVPSRSPGQLAIGAGAVWLTDPFAGGVWRIDAGGGAGPPPRIIAVDQGVDGVAAGAGAVWTSNTQTGTVARIDPATGRVAARIDLGGTPRALALGAGRLWVTVTGGGGASLAGSLDPGTDVKPVDSRNCGPVLAPPGGEADLLIVSDVPLEGSWRPGSEAMNAAVAFVLRAHRFRAGRFTIAMQPCNDALAQTGYPDEPKCRANATAYARNPAVIGVVGPVHSACTATMLPVLNRAPGGPVSVVSTFNSFVDLVRPDPDTARELYPTGRRGYARVLPSDDYEAAAGALFAQRLAPEGVFLAQDQFDPFWMTYFRRAARRIGLPIVDAATVEVDPGGRGNARRARMLAERVRASGARVVYLHGLAEAVPALRARLGSDVDLVFSGRTQPVATLFDMAGPDVRGAYLMIAGLPRERLGRAGRRFLRDFGATRPGGQVPTLALYAAAATEAMLDAIARSDGTRESVSRALAEVRLADGPLGPISFNRFGEPERNPIAAVRVDHGGEPHDAGGTQGGTVVEVIEPDARLVGAGGTE